MASWDDCAKRLFELEAYKKIAKKATLPEAGVVGDLGCGRGYLLKAIQEANPSLAIVGVDKKTSDCKKFLQSEQIPFTEIDANKITKDKRKGRLGAGIYLIEGDYHGMFHRFFDLSFMLFPSISKTKVKDSRTGLQMPVSEQNTAAFLDAVQILGRLIIVSEATVEGGTFVITNLAEADAESEYGKTGFLKNAESKNIPIKDGKFKALYNELYENNAYPYLFITVGKAANIEEKFYRDIKNLATHAANGNIGLTPLPKGIFAVYRMKGQTPVKRLMTFSKEMYEQVLKWFKV